MLLSCHVVCDMNEMLSPLIQENMQLEVNPLSCCPLSCHAVISFGLSWSVVLLRSAAMSWAVVLSWSVVLIRCLVLLSVCSCHGLLS